MIWSVPAIWEDGECWIIGGGPSIWEVFSVPIAIREKVVKGITPFSSLSPYMEVIRSRHVIGINNAYMLGVWVDVLFFGDSSWYLKHRNALAGWPGIKVTCDPKFINRSPGKMEGVKCLERDRERPEGITKDHRKVSWNKNSGAAAISLAVHFGVKRIYLLGFDMAMDGRAENSHWFGSYAGPGNKMKRTPPFAKHLKGFPAIAQDAKEQGIEIINVNPKSVIDVFPKVPLQEALDMSMERERV